MRSTELLQFMVENDAHIVCERGAPTGRLKRDLITIRGPNGGHIGLETGGFKTTGIELPPELFRDYVDHSFIRQDGSEDDDGRRVFRLTIDGRRAGHTPSTALTEIGEYVHANCGRYVPDSLRSLSQPEHEAKEHRIRTLAAELVGLGVQAKSRTVSYRDFEKILDRLHQEGFFPPDHLVSYVAHAIAH